MTKLIKLDPRIERPIKISQLETLGCDIKNPIKFDNEGVIYMSKEYQYLLDLKNGRYELKQIIEL